MNREEQLKWCQLCQRRKMDMSQGLLCSLTGAKADFEGECPNFEADMPVVKERQEEAKEEGRKSTIGGWLAFFLYFVIGLGCLASIFKGVLELKSGDMSIYGMPMKLVYVMYIASAVIAAISTIAAVHNRRTNAVSWARTYMVMIIIDGLVFVIGSILIDEPMGRGDVRSIIRSFIMPIVWLSYLSLSERVQNVIPPETRTWGRLEKIIFGVYTIAALSILYMSVSFANNPQDNLHLVDSDAFVREYVRDMNAEMDGGNTCYIEGKKIYMNYVMTETERDTLSFLEKLLIKSSFEESPEYMEEVRKFNSLGYSLCTRYINQDGDVMCEIEFTEAELKGEDADTEEYTDIEEDADTEEDTDVELLIE